MGSESTPIWVPRIASCSIAAGRLVSSEARRTFLPFFSFSRFASLAVVVVLPEPCRPTIRMTLGGLSIFSVSGASSPARTRISSSWTILTTICPGVIDFVTAAPVAFSVTRLMKSRATGRETSASSSAVRTSRSAVTTSASESAPCLVRRSKTPPSRSDRFSNIGRISVHVCPDMGRRGPDANRKRTRGRNALTDGDPGQCPRDRKRIASGKCGADMLGRGQSQACAG